MHADGLPDCRLIGLVHTGDLRHRRRALLSADRPRRRSRRSLLQHLQLFTSVRSVRLRRSKLRLQLAQLRLELSHSALRRCSHGTLGGRGRAERRCRVAEGCLELPTARLQHLPLYRTGIKSVLGHGACGERVLGARALALDLQAQICNLPAQICNLPAQICHLEDALRRRGLQRRLCTPQAVDRRLQHGELGYPTTLSSAVVASAIVAVGKLGTVSLAVDTSFAPRAGARDGARLCRVALPQRHL